MTLSPKLKWPHGSHRPWASAHPSGDPEFHSAELQVVCPCGPLAPRQVKRRPCQQGRLDISWRMCGQALTCRFAFSPWAPQIIPLHAEAHASTSPRASARMARHACTATAAFGTVLRMAGSADARRPLLNLRPGISIAKPELSVGLYYWTFSALRTLTFLHLQCAGHSPALAASLAVNLF